MKSRAELALFGGQKEWDVSEWTSSDDRVRGGKSQSYMVRPAGETANVVTFKGKLDIDTLGGAGFASQRTATETETWNLSEYDGVRVALEPLSSDNTKYTLILKDSLLPPDPDTGREQSTISYEVDFVIEPEESSLETVIRVFDFKHAFTANYRGKPVRDARALHTGAIRRFGIMNRSHFGQQKGEFHLHIRAITAIKISLDDADAARKMSSAPTAGAGRRESSSLATHLLAQRTEHLNYPSRTDSAPVQPRGTATQHKYHTFPTPGFHEIPTDQRRRNRHPYCILLSALGILFCIPLLFFCVNCLRIIFKHS